MAIRDFIAKGLRFECTACGRCCTNHDGHDFVFMTEQDLVRAAEKLGLTQEKFLERYTCLTQGERVLKDRGDRCIFLSPEGLCNIYDARPLQCRTFPFWPENLNEKTWNETIARDCPGVGRGEPVPHTRIEEYLTWDRRKRYPE
ncbi:MAG: YkgJ family cysteine cluster protein [Acidobacteria bacterium]|nr:YkgJ family cysteine cluster protein [Acidobacteriota bacterium]